MNASTQEDTLAAMTAEVVKATDRLIGMLTLINVGRRRMEKADHSFDEQQHVHDLLQAAVSLTKSTGARTYGAVETAVGDARKAEDVLLTRTWSSDTQAEAERATVDFEFWRDTAYQTPDTMLFDGFVDLAAGAVEQARMHRAAVANELALQESKAAADLILAALPDPSNPPALAGVSLFAKMMPAKLAGGDLFAWAVVEGELWFAVGDVSGKGLQAAVQMTSLATNVENAMRMQSAQGPAAVLQMVEQTTFDRLARSNMFATLCLGRWNQATGSLQLVNAGHSPVLFATDAAVQRIEASLPPLGVLAGQHADVWETTTNAKDVLVLGSDGLTEQQDARGQLFGEDRFDATVLQNMNVDSASELGARLCTELQQHAGGEEQSDDRTLMVLHFCDAPAIDEESDA